ncbi:MAG: glycosyltransferase family 39 protein, partial [Smithella sp.]
MNTKENIFIRFLRDNWIIISIALFNFFILFIPNFFGYYGYLRDELYTIACSKRLAWGYVDHPPFAVFLMYIIRFFLGDSIPAIRFLPAVAHASSIVLIGLITKRLGGKKFAQVMAGVAFSIMPVYLLMDSIYSKIFLEPFLLTVCILILLIIIQDHKKKYWLFLGLIIGIGLINKYTFVIYTLAILA